MEMPLRVSFIFPFRGHSVTYLSSSYHFLSIFIKFNINIGFILEKDLLFDCFYVPILLISLTSRLEYTVFPLIVSSTLAFYVQNTQKIKLVHT